ncbi:hypothetical protein [Parasphingopyxis sp.]|uniref:hypothetical protein n=1 Tax=Parasphingopyxis sp. TaxID=1920299 RepID=UPI0026304F1C|nr:hypothetical protein [Parasphingopyxis sp.]
MRTLVHIAIASLCLPIAGCNNDAPIEPTSEGGVAAESVRLLEEDAQVSEGELAATELQRAGDNAEIETMSLRDRCGNATSGQLAVQGITIGAWEDDVMRWFQCEGGYRVNRSRLNAMRSQIYGEKRLGTTRERIRFYLVGGAIPRVWRIRREVEYRDEVIPLQNAIDSVVSTYGVSHQGSNQYGRRYAGTASVTIDEFDFDAEIAVGIVARTRNRVTPIVRRMSVKIESRPFNRYIRNRMAAMNEARSRAAIEAGVRPEL